MENELNNKKSKKTILCLHASTGSGHKVCAESIALALEQIVDTEIQGDFKNCNIIVRDILDFLFCKADGNKAATLYTGALAPVHDVTWRYNFTGRLLWGGGTAFSRVAFQKLTSYLKNLRPDAIVCTHMIAANAAGGARALLAEHGIRYPIICVPTDYETEGLWPHKQTDLFCVCTQHMAETLRARNVPPECILCTGLPTAPQFNYEYDKEEVKQKFNLPKDKMVAVVMAGASEPKPYVNIRKALNKAFGYFAQMDWMHFVFCTGNDRNYYNYLSRKKGFYKADNVTILSYINNMAELMAASDLAICKAGGITVTECINTRLPILLVGRAYAQEHVNKRFLTALGIAYHATTPKEVVSILCQMTSNANLMKGMQVNCDTYRKPSAPYDVARATLNLAGCMEVDGKISDKAIRRIKTNQHRLRLAGIYLGSKPAHSR